jgi:beta-glucosidase/6-phospho-beta-glucosidase/beta-galactosidase
LVKRFIFLKNFSGAYYKNPTNASCLDFIGLNYISDVWVKYEKGFRLTHDIKDVDRQYMSDMGYAIYAEGFHDAIQSMSYLNIPICKFNI